MTETEVLNGNHPIANKGMHLCLNRQKRTDDIFHPWIQRRDDCLHRTLQNAHRHSNLIYCLQVHVQCQSKKSPPGDLTFFHFFHKWLRICIRFFTHLLYVPIFARLQIFIQLPRF